MRVELYGQYQTIAGKKDVVYPDFEKGPLRSLLEMLLADYPDMSRYLDLSDEDTVFSNALFLRGHTSLHSLDVEISDDMTILLLPCATGG